MLICAFIREFDPQADLVARCWIGSRCRSGTRSGTWSRMARGRPGVHLHRRSLDPGRRRLHEATEAVQRLRLLVARPLGAAPVEIESAAHRGGPSGAQRGGAVSGSRCCSEAEAAGAVAFRRGHLDHCIAMATGVGPYRQRHGWYARESGGVRWPWGATPGGTGGSSADHVCVDIRRGGDGRAYCHSHCHPPRRESRARSPKRAKAAWREAASA